MIAIFFLVASGAYAAVDKIYDNAFTASPDLDTGWNNTINSEMVRTDLMPGGYGVKNRNSDASIWISAADTFTFGTNSRYVMSYYINIQELTAPKSAFFGIGIYSGNTAVFRAGMNTGTGKFQIDRGTLANRQELSEYTVGKTYQVVVRIWKGSAAPAAAAYLYDVETGKLVASSSTLSSITGLNGILSVKVGGTGSSGAQYISGFTLLEAKDEDADFSTNVVNTDMKEAKLAEFPSEIGADDIFAMPEMHTATKGSAITYRCGDPDVIDAQGNIARSVTDKRIFIIAATTSGNIAIDRARAIVIKGTGSTAAAKENWAEAGTGLSGLYVPTENGFKGTWKNEYTLQSESSAPITSLGNSRLVWLKGINASDRNENTALYNELTKPIDMDINATYYANCIMAFESEKKDENVRFAKFGFLKDNTSTNEISTVLMLNADDLNLPRVGMKVNTSTAYAESKSANLGSLYHIMMKINSVTSGEDTVSIKMWPVGLEEPTAWTYIRTAELTGTYSKVFAQTNAVAGKGLYFGDFNYEIYVGNDAATVEAAEASVQNYITQGTALTDVAWPILGNTIAKRSYDNLTQHRNTAYISEIALYAGDTRIADITDASEGNIKVVVTVLNDADSTIFFDKTIYLAKYNENGKLEGIEISRPGEISANGSVDVELLLDNITDKNVRMFVFNDDIAPYIRNIKFNDSVKNY